MYFFWKRLCKYEWQADSLTFTNSMEVYDRFKRELNKTETSIIEVTFNSLRRNLWQLSDNV